MWFGLSPLGGHLAADPPSHAQTFAEIEPWCVARVLGSTALDVSHLDHEAVPNTAARIGPPVDEAARPIEVCPECRGFA